MGALGVVIRRKFEGAAEGCILYKLFPSIPVLFASAGMTILQIADLNPQSQIPNPKSKEEVLMTKSDLIEVMSSRIQDVKKKDLEIIINNIFENMKDALAKDDKVEIRGFGSFKVKKRQARSGRNPKTGKKINISAKRSPFFKAGKELRERINNG